ncbi:hypothetical protein ETB97_001464 [Aspergillus alliaceus]|uniref:Uncharacterized protein n=1 Tax=Petromyces alliaceus TaxID=209559 RepID=A0A8H6A4J2_PETAA|nr:hypothetical protein ETB97_001464 [Aspergillus burnettii]
MGEEKRSRTGRTMDWSRNPDDGLSQFSSPGSRYWILNRHDPDGPSPAKGARDEPGPRKARLEEE